MRQPRKARTRAVGLVLVLLLAGPVAALAGQAKLVRVDCAKATLQDALERNADELIVEFEGVCVEDVVIRRDHTTLRGLAPDATIVGSQGPPGLDAAGVVVAGASDVTLSDFLVRDGRRGVVIRGGGAVRLERLTLQGHSREGLLLIEGGDATAEDCAALGNTTFGVGVWDASSLRVRSTLVARGSSVGLLVSTGGSVTTSIGSRIEADDNSFGIVSQLGGVADLRGGEHAARQNTFGVVSFFDGYIQGSLQIYDNASIGAYAASESVLIHDGPVLDNGVFGIFGEGGARIEYGGPEVSGHALGLVLDGTEARISDATVPDPVELTFGTRVDFAGGNGFSGGVSCDGTVLVRGDVSCPSALGRAARRVPEAGGVLRPPAAPFALEP